MFLADAGYGVLWLILAVSLWATLASAQAAWGRRPELLSSARNALLAAAALATLSAALLLVLLFSRSLEVQYVQEHVSSFLKPVYVLAAFWAGLEGSQLLWLWMLSLVTAALVLRRPTWDQELRPYAMAMLAFTQGFFALLLVTETNPFQLLATVETEGVSLNPLLQNFWMIVHPPIIFAAYALWTVPAAYGLAALVTGRLDATWLHGTRRWMLAAWASLGVGILVGAWWAYLELGWGGYWGWDPVENSSLIPWLVGTALVHSAIIQERRDMFRAWNVILAVLTFLLTVFATFVTRSGLIQSVHAFAASRIGYYYLGFMLAVLAVTIGLAAARTRQMKGAGQLGDLFSREFVFLLTNLLFLGLALAVLLGTLWPTVTGIGGEPQTLSKEGYNRIAGPLGLVLLLLVGICPLIDWRKTAVVRVLQRLGVQTVAAAVVILLAALLGHWPVWAAVGFGVTAFVAATIVLQLAQGVSARMRTARENPLVATVRAVANNRRRYGGQLIHLSVVVIVAGIVGSQAHQAEVQVALAPGDDVEVEGYTLYYRDFAYRQIEEEGNKAVHQAVLDVYRGERKLATARPERNLHTYAKGALTEVALRSTPKEDLYVVLASLEADGRAAIQVLVTPMVMWLWIGGLVLIAGTLVAGWPGRARRAPNHNTAGRPE